MERTDSVGTDSLLPYERAESPADTNKGLLAALESELDSDPQMGLDDPAGDEGEEPDPAAATDEPEDGEPEDESEDSEESDESEDEEPEPVYKVKVDGAEVEVTLEEALRGYQREADYTRKTQALANDRRELQAKVDAEASELRQRRDQYAERLEALALALDQQAPAQQDWAKLRKENPTEYAVRWAEYQEHKEQQDTLLKEQKRVYDERLEAWERDRTAYLEDQKQKLVAALPEWSDPAKEQAEKGKLVEYLTGTYGWTAQDLEGVTDHRLMIALRKAMLYDEGQHVAKEKIHGKIKPASAPLKPGARERTPVRGQKLEARKSRERLRRTGRTEDAAAHFERFLDD